MEEDQPVLIPVLKAHRFDEAALSKYLQRKLPGFRGDLNVQQYVGGTSNPTFRLTSNDDRWVLRKRPPGHLLPSAHQVEREHRVMHALRDSDVPVPKMHHHCDDPSIIGQEFYVMEMIEGRTTTSEMTTFSPDERRAIYDDFIRILAALHQVDHIEVGLERHGRPGNYFARQIDRWSKQYRASQTDDLAEMDRLIDWMPEHIPAGDETAVIHGDYRIGNTLIHPSEPRIAAILDWELSTLGHPLGDLSYHPAYAHQTEFQPIIDELPERGIPTEDEWRQRYCQLTGRGDIENWNFYVAYNLFRLAGIVQGVYKRALDGIASSELEIDSQRDRVAHCSQRAWQLVEEMS
ncbi:MAG: phosphotransferase family protein [Pseudomonadales bacterium]|jgi:aminoglycoside phosphotransferase (APT) family kinase protein|nr:phosphotransferase family protein [Pseudomonadales bacterium]MDP7596431.1 phosphotransferase family protein [Pseudomonadales bacterium]HJN51386.1 phosphotransferase family protein [Pseudomonadales bacterium]|tara:strand:+ start:476 stop:1519 length:1044 start_codon:yes stop_codon:yes gene_type:complete